MKTNAPRFTDLLCIASAQPIPNLLSVVHFRPSRVLVLESLAMKRDAAAAKLQAAIRVVDQALAGRVVVVPVADENSVAGIRAPLRALLGTLNGETLVGNVTGGTKLLSIVTYDTLRSCGAQIVYTPADRPDELIWIHPEAEAEKINYRPGFEEIFAAHGMRIIKQQAVPARDALVEYAVAIAAAALDANPIGDRSRLADVDDYRKLLGREARRVGQAQRDRALPNHRLDEREAAFMTGAWLEVFWWAALKRFGSRLGLASLGLNVEIEHAASSARNEFDVVCMNHLTTLLFECKSGRQLRSDRDGILYKEVAVARAVGTLKYRAYLVTTIGDFDEGSGQESSAIWQRAQSLGCRIVDRRAVQRIALAWDTPIQATALLEAALQ